MLCGVPNLALTLGYTNASWTLKADLVAQYVCRAAQPHGRAGAADLHAARARRRRCRREPIIDLSPATCCARSTRSRKQGASAPWRLHQNYVKDVRLLKRGPLDDAIEFSAPAGPVSLCHVETPVTGL